MIHSLAAAAANNEEMRLTNKKLIQLVNEMFVRLEIKDVEAYEAYSTRYRGQDYEGGAATMVVRFAVKGDKRLFGELLFFDWRKDLEAYLNSGHMLSLDPCTARYSINDAHVITVPAPVTGKK